MFVELLFFIYKIKLQIFSYYKNKIIMKWQKNKKRMPTKKKFIFEWLKKNFF